MKQPSIKIAVTVTVSALLSMGCTAAEDTSAAAKTVSPKITMGDGELNSIQIDGLVRETEARVFSDTRTNGPDTSTFRTNSTGVTFPKVIIEKPGWIVLHPVIDGKPDGDIVSGFTYLTAGETSDVTINMVHPADSGAKYLVMLHNDVNEDRVFDFVFVADGINVEDRAVFEGSRMVAHFIELP